MKYHVQKNMDCKSNMQFFTTKTQNKLYQRFYQLFTFTIVEIDNNLFEIETSTGKQLKIIPLEVINQIELRSSFSLTYVN